MPTPINWIPLDATTGHVRTGPHRMIGQLGKRRLSGYRYCVQCGLIALRNDATRRALRQSCKWLDD